MSRYSQFELVEDTAVTTSGFELSVNVARHSAAHEGEITITRVCATFGEFDAEITRLINELEEIRTAGETRFADGPFGPTPIFS